MKTKKTTPTGDAITTTLKPGPRTDGKSSKQAQPRKRAHGRSKISKSKAAVQRDAVKAAKTKSSRAVADRSAGRLAVGTKLTRTFKGKQILVEVIEGGFKYQGQTFGSISACARHITGYQISGPIFFRLAEPKPAAAEEK